MVKYFCEICNNEISKRYTIAVKPPGNDTQPNIHLCEACFSVLRGYADNMRKVVEERRAKESASAVIPEKLIGESVTMKTDVPRVAIKPAGTAVAKHSSTKHDNTTLNATDTTSSVKSITTAADNKSMEVGDLPKIKHGRLDEPRLRRILIDYYSGVNENATLSRCHCDKATYKRLIRNYASETVRKRYDENRTYMLDGKKINAGDVLSMYAAGIPIKEIERDTGYVDSVIKSILTYFTGV